jgi:hypothetical protein
MFFGFHDLHLGTPTGKSKIRWPISPPWWGMYLRVLIDAKIILRDVGEFNEIREEGPDITS